MELDRDHKVLVFVFYIMPRLSLDTSDVCSDLNMRAAEWLLASRRPYMLTSSRDKLLDPSSSSSQRSKSLAVHPDNKILFLFT